MIDLYINSQQVEDIFLEKYDDIRLLLPQDQPDTLELIGLTMIATKDAFFRKPPLKYIKREHEWYLSQSLYIKDIPGETPEIWKKIASKEGKINSNYGWMVFSEENGNQYLHVLDALLKNKETRQGNMIYTRPSIHKDAFKDGMYDFTCTNNVEYLIRDNKLIAFVNMRSNDMIRGFPADYAWQKYVQKRLYDTLRIKYNDLKLGEICWRVASGHIYKRDFYVIEKYLQEKLGK